jgi:hypothetical protein
MPRYTVLRRDVYIQLVAVDAETPEVARDMVRNGGGTIVSCQPEFTYTMDSGTWGVEDENGELVLD